jgi:hypothetical protein
MSANLKCIQDKAQLVSFEDSVEMRNFARNFPRESNVEEFMTSAIRFGNDPAAGWFWIGSSQCFLNSDSHQLCTRTKMQTILQYLS